MRYLPLFSPKAPGILWKAWQLPAHMAWVSDWCITPALARQMAGPKVVLQGNFDPAKLLAPIPVIEQEVTQMLEAFGGHGHIANLGHGILPNVPVDHARAFVNTVKNYRHKA